MSYNNNNDEYVFLGRTRNERTDDGKGIWIGYITDEESKTVTKNRVYLDVKYPHVILICGKRGYGKSYTMGVIVEELAQLMNTPEFGKKLSAIVIDTMSVFGYMNKPNIKQQDILRSQGLEAETFENIQNFIPKGLALDYQKYGWHYDEIFTIDPSDLDLGDWMFTFDLNDTAPMGMLLSSVITYLDEEYGTGYGLDTIINAIKKLSGSETEGVSILTRRALLQRFKAAQSWGIFDEVGTSIYDIAKPGMVSVLDVSGYRQANAWGLRSLIVGILAKKIYERRILYRKSEEYALLTNRPFDSRIVNTWFFIDEAHQFIPTGSGAAKSAMSEWLQQGRQPGLSIVMATQRPNALDKIVSSQLDVLISHHITSRADREALKLVTPTYRENLAYEIGNLPPRRGLCIVMDDKGEQVINMKIKPRKTHHGGDDSVL
ncbi:MAG: ATP-binding protein [Candidatus Hodarchaeales archaeon]|jgi:DNA helicase HerA-like ATPase